MKMLLKSVEVTDYKSIEKSGDVSIDSMITGLVGVNESGKSAFLEAIHKSKPVFNDASFDVVTDYPRRRLVKYQKKHQDNPAVVIVTTLMFTDSEIKGLESEIGKDVMKKNAVTATTLYKGSRTIGLECDESKYLKNLTRNFSTTAKKTIKEFQTIAECVQALNDHSDELGDLDQPTEEGIDKLKDMVKDCKEGWNPLKSYIFEKFVKPNEPQYLLFDEYRLIPGKINLESFLQRKTDDKMTENDRNADALMSLADVSASDLISPASYEESVAKLEAISAEIGDQIFKFWPTDAELEILFDVKEDPQDIGEFKNGKNLYIRIRNRRHRASVLFDKRSQGFQWFFSFLVWFETVQNRVEQSTQVTILLDEPGLNLHALAQKKLLDYLEELACKHQILYTTHSPFMVRNDKLNRIRVVEDSVAGGTTVSDNLMGANERTLFPLQAALGYDIAQNLFISKRNLLVEGPSELAVLTAVSSQLDSAGRQGLRSDVTVVPTGGMDKISTFIALMAGNKLKLAVLHDFRTGDDQTFQKLLTKKIIDKKVHVLLKSC